MRVRYTPDVFRFQRAGGVSRYFVELCGGLRRAGVDAHIHAGLHINQLIDGRDATGLDVSAIGPPRARQAVTKVVDQLWSTTMIVGSRPGSILHPTWYMPSGSRLPTRGQVVVTVFDMIPEMFPDQAIRADSASRRKRAWVERADRVIVISDTTRRDLVELFGTDPAKVTVTPLGVSAVDPVPVTASMRLADPFLLYVGDRNSPYKNFVAVLDAMSTPEVDRGLHLVCVGSSLTEQERTELSKRGLTARVSALAATDGELAWLYSRAHALVYPSLYEGFGLPLVEAMASGCPVIASDAASIPEVTGDAALLFPPAERDALLGAIREIADPRTRSALVDAGRARAAMFTWSTTVERTLEVYRKALAGRS